MNECIISRHEHHGGQIKNEMECPEINFYVVLNFTDVSLKGLNWQYFIIYLGNGLVSEGRQPISWNNDPVIWHIYASTGLSELRTYGRLWSISPSPHLFVTFADTIK